MANYPIDKQTQDFMTFNWFRRSQVSRGSRDWLRGQLGDESHHLYPPALALRYQDLPSEVG